MLIGIAFPFHCNETTSNSDVASRGRFAAGLVWGKQDWRGENNCNICTITGVLQAQVGSGWDHLATIKRPLLPSSASNEF
jgi:hypothetical protein